MVESILFLRLRAVALEMKICAKKLLRNSGMSALDISKLLCMLVHCVCDSAQEYAAPCHVLHHFVEVGRFPPLEKFL